MRFAPIAPLACFVINLAVTFSASARIGETQEEVEHRLLQPFIGKFIPKDKTPDPAKEQELLQQQPFNAFRIHFPDGTRERKYWKSAVPNVLSNENGWRLHVFFLDNHSVLEAYQRIGDTLSDFEMQNILRANQGTSEWRRLDADSDDAKASAIGCDYQLADGSLRAKIVDSWIMVYSVKFDARIKDHMKLLDSTRANQEEERARQQQASASGSTAGF